MKIYELFENFKPTTFPPELQNWFGKSKIVDDDGNPKVVYRGVSGNNTNIAPAFYTAHPSEASAYTSASDIGRAHRMRKRVHSANGKHLIGKRVPYVGIIDDVESYNAVWGTDEGVVSVDKQKGVTYYTDVVPDSKSFEMSDGAMSIKLQAGNNEAYNEKMAGNEDTIKQHYSGGEESRVYPVYLKIENPKYLSPLEANIITKRFGSKAEQRGNELVKRLKKEGYDGIITSSDEASLNPEMAQDLGGVPEQYIPFNKSQVRSVFKKTK